MNRTTPRRLGLAAAMLLATWAPASAAQELSLDQALSLAAEASPATAAANDVAAAAELAVAVARAERYPSLKASFQSTGYDGEVFYARFVNLFDPGSVDPDAPPTDVSGFSSAVSSVVTISQPLYAGGALAAEIDAREVEHQLARGELERRRLELRYEVTRSYYELLLADASVAIAEQSLERSEGTLATVEKRRAVEEALEVESLGARARLAQDRHRLLVARNAAQLARLALNRHLGWNEKARPNPIDSLEAPGRELDEEQLLRRVLAGSPLLRQAEQRIELAGQRARQARSHFKPKLRLEGLYTWVDNDLFFRGHIFQARLGVSIPFAHEIRAGRSAVAQAEAHQRAQERLRAEAEATATLIVRSAVRHLQEAYEAIDLARENLAYRREKHRVTALAFDQGMALLDQLNDEHVELAEAEGELYRAFYQARLGEAQIDRLAAGS